MKPQLKNTDFKLMLKRAASVLAAVFIIFIAFITVICPKISASENKMLSSGICGTEDSPILWQLYEDGHIFFSGSGELGEFSADGYTDKILCAEFSDGITCVSDSAFYGCENLQRVILPSTVSEIGKDAFNGCSDLSDIYYYGSEEKFSSISVNSVGNDSFSGAQVSYGFCSKHKNTVSFDEEAADCLNDGYSSGTYCEDCMCWITGHYKITAVNHKNKYNTEKVPSTCTDVGYQAGVYCPDCKTWLSGHESIEPHSFSVYTSDNNATCVADGTKTAVCDVCKTAENTVTDVGSKETAEHKYSVRAGSMAVCIYNGEKIYVCDVCEKASYTEIIPATGKHKFSACLGEDPTCTQDGFIEYCCEWCETETYRETVKATGHSYNFEITEEPTCSKSGIKTYTCSCGDTYTEIIKAKGHTVVTDKAVAATCTKTGLTAGSHCLECKAVITKQNTVAKKVHTADKGTITKQATYTSTGTKTYKCTSCKATLKTEEIARLTLSKVSGLKASSIGTTSLKFTWNKVTGAEKYEVYYSTNGKSWKKVTTTKNSVTVKKLKTGTTYKVKVRAVAGSNTGSYSSVLVTSTKPSKVTLTKLTSSKKKLTAQWKTISGATGYEVVYSTSKKFTKKTTKTVTLKKAKTKKTTLKKLKSGKKYYVKVRAYKTVNGKKIYGSYSSVKTVKVK